MMSLAEFITAIASIESLGRNHPPPPPPPNKPNTVTKVEQIRCDKICSHSNKPTPTGAFKHAATTGRDPFAPTQAVTTELYINGRDPLSQMGR